jgi:hypothetical protein
LDLQSPLFPYFLALLEPLCAFLYNDSASFGKDSTFVRVRADTLKITGLLIALLLFWPLLGESANCPTWLSRLRMERQSTPEFRIVENEVEIFSEVGAVSVRKNSFGFDASVEDGILEFSITTKLFDGKRDPDFRGQQTFDAMLEHFGGQFHAIKGFWIDRLSDPEKSDNFVAFQEASQKGHSQESAAIQTWTGQQACRHGFCHPVVIVRKDGLVTWVEAYFFKTEAEAKAFRFISGY